MKIKKVKVNHIKVKLDSDRDGVPDYKDCRPFNPKKQHTKKWKQQMMKMERFKRDYADEVTSMLKKGWREDKAISYMVKKKKQTNLDKLVSRYEKAIRFPGVVGFDASDIRRTKDVIAFIEEKNLKDVGNEIRL